MAKPAPIPTHERGRAKLLRAVLKLVPPAAEEPSTAAIDAPAPTIEGPVATGLIALDLPRKVTLAYVGDGAQRFITDVRTHLGPTPHIHVFEPRPLHLRDLAHLAMSDMRLVIHSCTLGAREDEAHIKGKRLAVRPLDAVGIAPDVLCINAPGCEIEVLRGARRVLRRWRPTLLVAGLFPDSQVEECELSGYLACSVQDGLMAPRRGGEDHVWFVSKKAHNQA